MEGKTVSEEVGRRSRRGQLLEVMHNSQRNLLLSSKILIEQTPPTSVSLQLLWVTSMFLLLLNFVHALHSILEMFRKKTQRSKLLSYR